MGRRLEYDVATAVLTRAFSETTALFEHGTPPTVSSSVEKACDILFASSIQAYREALLGCALAKVTDSSIDIRRPQVNQSTQSFSGRSLDEKVVNQALVAMSIPCSKGPYLAVFRRDWSFYPRGGVRDPGAYDCMLSIISTLESSEPETREDILRYLLYRFLMLREESDITVETLPPMSSRGYFYLVCSLLSQKSGGRFPLFAVAAALQGLGSSQTVPWEVSVQGINEADAASGAGGDITVTILEQCLFSVEVTERKVTSHRVETTYWTKVKPNNVNRYLFISSSDVSPDVRAKANQYQHCSFYFLKTRDWLIDTLAVMDGKSHGVFNVALESQIRADSTPKAVRLAWNSTVRQIRS